jgi:hypothetical protein
VSHVLSFAENAAKLACIRAGDLLSFAEFPAKPHLPSSSVSAQTRHKLTLHVWPVIVLPWSQNAEGVRDRKALADGWRQARRSKDELMKERDLYSIDEARERLGGISRNLIYEILRSGRLSSVVLGSRRFIPAAAIAQLIAQSATTISPTEAAARSYIPTKQPIDIPHRRPSQRQ